MNPIDGLPLHSAAKHVLPAVGGGARRMTDDLALPVDSAADDRLTTQAPPPPIRARVPRPVFFAVSPLKLVVMSVVTLGAYELFWFYANWQRLRRRGQPRISPFWRTTFAYFTCYSLFKTVKDEGQLAKVSARFSPLLMAVGWVITSLLWRLPGLAALLPLAAVVFLLPVQKTVNELNRALAPGHDPNDRFGAWNFAGIAIGGLILLLDVWASFLPD